jgi:hypothetical protein
MKKMLLYALSPQEIRTDGLHEPYPWVMSLDVWLIDEVKAFCYRLIGMVTPIAHCVSH